MGAHKPWFRFHVAALEDPKVQCLPSELFKAWVNLLCVAAKNDGKIPGLAEAAYGLRLKEHKAAALIAKLAVAGLFDRVHGGYYEPHNWGQWQYKSDHSTERVQLHRHRKRNLRASVRPVAGRATAAAEREGTVSCNDAKPFHETEQSRSEHNRSDDDERKTATKQTAPETNFRARALTKEIVILVGFDPNRLPAGWINAHRRVQRWIEKGWSEDAIRASVRLQCESPHRATPRFVQYFEPGIVDYIARQDSPLPEVTQRSARKVRTKYAQHDPTNDPRSGLGAILRLRDRPEMQAGSSNPSDGDSVRLLPSGPLRES